MSNVKKQIALMQSIRANNKKIYANSLENNLGVIAETEKYEKKAEPLLEALIGPKEDDSGVKRKPLNLGDVLATNQSDTISQLKAIEAAVNPSSKTSKASTSTGPKVSVTPATPPPPSSPIAPSLPPTPSPAYTNFNIIKAGEAFYKQYEADKASSAKRDMSILGANTGSFKGIVPDKDALLKGNLYVSKNGVEFATPVTPGLAQLLLTKAFNPTLIDDNDKLMYKEFANKFIPKNKPILGTTTRGKYATTLLGSSGSGLRPDSFIRQSYVKPDGRFGRVKIDLDDLKGGFIHTQELETGKTIQRMKLKNPKEIHELLVKKRVVRPDWYDKPEIMTEYNEVLKMAGVRPTHASVKNKMALAPPVNVLDTEDALQKLDMALSELDAGNTSSTVKNNVVSLLDFLRLQRIVTKKQIKEIYENYLLDS